MFSDWTKYFNHLLELERSGVITRTFRRLDPERQKLILQSIMFEAVSKESAHIRIKDIADKAGVSVGSLYQYFPGRDCLLTFAVEMCSRYMSDLFDLTLPYLQELPLRDALQSYLSYGIQWGQTEINLIRFFGRAAYQNNSDELRAIVRPVGEKMRRLMEILLQNAAARGELRQDVDIPAAARLLHVLTVTLGDSHLLPYLDDYFQIGTDGMPFERAVTALLEWVEKGWLNQNGQTVP